MPTYIGLLDCNNFFVSCERLFRPDLQRRPVVVLSSNDGCVVARSQEIKDKGIPMGVPYYQVKDILSDIEAELFSSHFALYRDISRRIFDLVRDQVDVFEQYSIDEGFFLVRGDDPQKAAEVLKTDIERDVGIPVSVGVAATKTQAKYANTTTKRQQGAWYMEPEVFTKQAAQLPLSALWGVGSGRSRAFTQHGLQTVADLSTADPMTVRRLFGVEGARLQFELRGKSAYPVKPHRVPQQSVMSSRSFRSPSCDWSVVQDALAYHVRHAVSDLRAQEQVTGLVRVLLRANQHGAYALRGGVRGIALSEPSNDTFVILRAAMTALADIWEPRVPYQKVGIILSDLSSTAVAQQPLFTTDGPPDRSAVLRTIDTLNQRYGLDTIRLGSTLKEALWQAKRDQLSPAYTTRWSDIPMVSAR